MTVSYVILLFVFTLALCVLCSYRKNWLSYLSHTISLYLHGKLINWTSTFYMRFYCTVLYEVLLYGFIWGFIVRFYRRFYCTVLYEVLLYGFIWGFIVRFYLEYWIHYYSIWIGLFQLFEFVNYILCFFLCNFTSHGICIE